MANFRRRELVNNKHFERADFVDQRILGVDKNLFLITVTSAFVDSVLAENRKQKGQNCLHHKSEEERVKFVKEKFHGKIFPAEARQPEIRKKYEKHSESSKRLRNHGNSLFKERKFQDALHYYNMALLFGLDESLGLAYANRAAVLMELDDPAGALQDIDLALQHNYPASQVQKLEQRKLKCVEMIEKTASEDATIQHLIDKERAELIKIRDSFIRIEKQNPKAPAAAEFVEIKFDETHGRQLVVNRDVDAGTLLLVEDPFVCVLESQLNWDTEHCHHCFKRIRRGIPCEKCVFAFYCDEACLKKALESTHGIECSIMPYLHLNRMPDHAYEALKLICKVGPVELYRLFTTRDPAFLDRNQAFGTAPGDNYESDSYLSVYHLESHPECLEFVEQCVHIHQSLIILEYLHTETEFFESIPKDQVNEFKNFVAALMDHQIDRHIVNSVSLTEFDGLEDLTLETFLRQRTQDPEKLLSRLKSQDFQWEKYASGIHPLFSLLNHSCDPNATYFNHMTNGTMTVVAERRMKKGEQICISYIRTFFHDAKKDREAKLNALYNFVCNCIACRNNWPTAMEMIKVCPRFCCPCSKSFSHEEKDSAEFLRCELSGPLWMCGRCGRRYDFVELEKRLRVNMKLSYGASDLLLRGQPQEALRITLKLLEYFQSALIPPEGLLHVLHENSSNSLSFILQLAQE